MALRAACSGNTNTTHSLSFSIRSVWDWTRSCFGKAITTAIALRTACSGITLDTPLLLLVEQFGLIIQYKYQKENDPSNAKRSVSTHRSSHRHRASRPVAYHAKAWYSNAEEYYRTGCAPAPRTSATPLSSTLSHRPPDTASL